MAQQEETSDVLSSNESIGTEPTPTACEESVDIVDQSENKEHSGETDEGPSADEEGIARDLEKISSEIDGGSDGTVIDIKRTRSINDQGRNVRASKVARANRDSDIRESLAMKELEIQRKRIQLQLENLEYRKKRDEKIQKEGWLVEEHRRTEEWLREEKRYRDILRRLDDIERKYFGSPGKAGRKK